MFFSTFDGNGGIVTPPDILPDGMYEVKEFDLEFKKLLVTNGFVDEGITFESYF